MGATLPNRKRSLCFRQREASSNADRWRALFSPCLLILGRRAFAVQTLLQLLLGLVVKFFVSSGRLAGLLPELIGSAYDVHFLRLSHSCISLEHGPAPGVLGALETEPCQASLVGAGPSIQVRLEALVPLCGSRSKTRYFSLAADHTRTARIRNDFCAAAVGSVCQRPNSIAMKSLCAW
jgi:hypothetical protein